MAFKFSSMIGNVCGFFNSFIASDMAELASYGKWDEVEKLLDANHNPNIYYGGATPLHYLLCAVPKPYGTLIKLYDHGVDPNLPTKFVLNVNQLPSTPLETALQIRDESIIKSLMMHPSISIKTITETIAYHNCNHPNQYKKLSPALKCRRLLEELLLQIDEKKNPAEKGQVYKQIAILFLELKEEEAEPNLKNYYQRQAAHWNKMEISNQEELPASSAPSEKDSGISHRAPYTLPSP